LVTTAVLDETVLPFALELTLALVSITPSRAGLPLVAAPLAFAALRLFAFAFVFESLPPQPYVKLAAAKTAASAKVRRIEFLPRRYVLFENRRM
jgi:hypothetical protein